jgi:methyl-accepting chemotaxis protein
MKKVNTKQKLPAKKGKTTIKGRIGRGIVFSGLLQGFLMTICSVALVTTVAKCSAAEDARQVAEAYVRMVSNTVGAFRSQIELVSYDQKAYDEALTVAQRKDSLDPYLDATYFKDFSVAYADGTTYNDTDISERDYFQEAMNGDTYISSPLIRKTDNSLTIMIGTKSHYAGFNGAVYGGVDYTYFSNIVSQIKIGDAGYGYIVGKTGTIIAAADAGGRAEKPAGDGRTDPEHRPVG